MGSIEMLQHSYHGRILKGSRFVEMCQVLVERNQHETKTVNIGRLV